MGFIKKVAKGIKGAVKKAAGGILKKLNPKNLLKKVTGLLEKIPGFGKVLGGALKLAEKLFKNPMDLLNPMKLFAALSPAALLGSFGNLNTQCGCILNNVGGLEALNAEQAANLIHVAQASAWQMGCQKYL